MLTLEEKDHICEALREKLDRTGAVCRSKAEVAWFTSHREWVLAIIRKVCGA